MEEILTTGQRVKQLRKKLHLTQLEFSKKISLSAAQIACIETGKRKVNDRIIKLICTAFNANEKWLKTGEGEIFNQFNDAKFTQLNALFSNLLPKYQKFVLEAIDEFLKIQDENNGDTPS
ncbi:hypothetical protein FACS1894164_20340 [Spirochaetia bacterium]|nr:hypothetical protein FACS1894164_20340 [Spirochaetia bacterium]